MRPREEVPTDELLTAYANGERSVRALAAHFGVNRSVVALRLAEAGVVVKARVAPFGWRRRGKELVADPTEQQVIKRIVAARAKGKSWSLIAQALDMWEVTGRDGGRWTASQVQMVAERAEGKP